MSRAVDEAVRARVPELRQANDPSEVVAQSYRRFAVVGGGLITQPAFFALITYILIKNPVALAVAGSGVFLLALHMPSHEHLRRLPERGMQSF